MAGPRSAPPDLPGYTFAQGVGGGGFADVFLYNRHRPARKVAVKVLRKEHLSADMLRQFESEADVMAEVSAHPYIVTIFGMGVAPDGRPFIEMEYYPNPHFGLRAQGGALAVAEVLRVGVQVCAAVETAHRAGILHRDVKPANILTSAYGRPGLTDFGIASVTRDGAASAAAGLSVAFAAPEAVRDESAGSVAGDVYGLCATLHTLLTGTSPFLVPGGENNLPRIIDRVLRSEIPAIARSDSPPSLQNLLRQGMAADPVQRPSSALALARSLNDIERELHLSTTAIDVEEVALAPGPSDPGQGVPAYGDDDGTRAAAIQVVSPDGVAKARRGSVPPIGVGSGVEDHTLARPSEASFDFGVKAPTEVAGGGAKARRSGSGGGPTRPSNVVIAVAVFAALFVVAVLGAKLAGRSDTAPPTTTSTVFADPSVDFSVPDAPSAVSVILVGDGTPDADGNVRLQISWQAKEAQPGDTYSISRCDTGHEDDTSWDAGTASPFLGATVGASEKPCLRVSAERNGRRSEASAKATLSTSSGSVP